MEHKGGSLRVVLVLMAVLWLVAGPGATPGSADSLWEWLYWILCSPIPPGEARPDEYYAAMCKGALKEYEQEKTALTGPQLLSVVALLTDGHYDEAEQKAGNAAGGEGDAVAKLVAAKVSLLNPQCIGERRVASVKSLLQASRGLNSGALRACMALDAVDAAALLEGVPDEAKSSVLAEASLSLAQALPALRTTPSGDARIDLFAGALWKGVAETMLRRDAPQIGDHTFDGASQAAERLLDSVLGMPTEAVVPTDRTVAQTEKIRVHLGRVVAPMAWSPREVSPRARLRPKQLEYNQATQEWNALPPAWRTEGLGASIDRASKSLGGPP